MKLCTTQILQGFWGVDVAVCRLPSGIWVVAGRDGEPLCYEQQKHRYFLIRRITPKAYWCRRIDLAGSAERTEKGEGKSKNTFQGLLKWQEFGIGYRQFVAVVLASWGGGGGGQKLHAPRVSSLTPNPVSGSLRSQKHVSYYPL